MENKIDIEKFKKSSIGTHVDCPEEALDVDLKYSRTSWFFISVLGTTRMPYQIDFTCKKTGERFESITDKNLIEHYMHYRKV